MESEPDESRESRECEGGGEKGRRVDRYQLMAVLLCLIRDGQAKVKDIVYREGEGEEDEEENGRNGGPAGQRQRTARFRLLQFHQSAAVSLTHSQRSEPNLS